MADARRAIAAWAAADWPGLAIALGVLAAAHLAYAPVVGFGWDDGVYVAAGRALAEGHGYLLPGRAGYQTVPTFPAGYPLLLALLWRLAGTTAVVLRLASLVSALCAAGAAYLWWRIIRVEHGRWATALVAVPAFAYGSLAVATSRMSDAPYALVVALAATLWPRVRTSSLALAALVTAAVVAVPLRTAGVALAASVFLLLLARRRWIAAAALAAVSVLGAGALVTLLRPPQPSYLELIRAAWADGGAGGTILAASFARGLWEALASFLTPPLVYSGAVQNAVAASRAAGLAYAAVLAIVGGSAVWGGWLRLRTDRWSVGDLALLGALALPCVAPMGMDPRFLAPYGPVIALWAFETARRGIPALAPAARRGVRAAPALLAAFLACWTAFQSLRALHRVREASVTRASAYLGAAGAARAWLGARGLVVAEFPETLWLLGGIRAVSTTSPLENVLLTGAAENEVRRRVGAVARGCLLDTRTFATSRAAFDALAGRRDATVLLTPAQQSVRVVCWEGGPATPVASRAGEATR